MQSTYWIKFFSTLAAFSAFLSAAPAQAVSENQGDSKAHYTKYEYRIPMRDGIKLFTAVYVPKDAAQRYPILINRTPYSIAPYGVDNYPALLGPSAHFDQEGFIFVHQDVRGRYMSEGEFENVRPILSDRHGQQAADESTDMHDTIEWLLKHIPNHNGRVGVWGISYPGFYAAAGMVNTHPALKAASPQGAVVDLYMGDDVYHNGAFMLAASFGFSTFFTPRKGAAELPAQRVRFDFGTPDGYHFFLNLGPLSEVNQKFFSGEARYWQEMIDHTTYDEFWQRRSLWRFMKRIKCAVLNVGGWFDAENLAGPLRVYHSVEKNNPGIRNQIVMGPWRHGGWARGRGDKVGNIHFPLPSAEFFREKIQFPFFMHHLKNQSADFPEAFMFLTGINEWRRHNAWPPKSVKPLTLYFQANQCLSTVPPSADEQSAFDEYISDPGHPVPHLGYIVRGMASNYMTEDQRFAARRTDVLVYQTAPFAQDLIIAGPIKVKLNVSTTGTDADFIVKLIDVYPNNYPTPKSPLKQPILPNAVKMGGYQQLVRGEPFRGKFRNSFKKPAPFVPGQSTAVHFEMPDIYHAFRKGHRIMVQIQSSWFPLVDRNPQKFMEIPKAIPADFQKATHRIYHSSATPSSITILSAE